MKNRTIFLLCAMIILLAPTLLIACSSQESDLFGVWKVTTPLDEINISVIFFLGDRIEFLRDGTFVLPDLFNTSGTYSIPERGKITFSGPQGAITLDYTLSGDKLILGDEGASVEFHREK